MTTGDGDFMDEALALAREAAADGELPFGAVIVCDGEVIAAGRCREAKAKSVIAHAELEVVDAACRKLGRNRLSDCTIYCTNEPCVMCAAAIFQAKIPRVVIGASRSDIGFLRQRKVDIEMLAQDSGYVIEIICGVKKQAVVELFKDLQ